ncbi:hypothetical protein, partial [uncultured Flavonifractor sp.]|uniref:hypothetical protein n=1 Tax=uncultured Flavonifractor sp. TaxID=1193534 RepID=UPI002621DB53
ASLSPPSAILPLINEKAQPKLDFFDKRLHDGWGSISCEKVTPSVMRSVISEAHVPGNDGF